MRPTKLSLPFIFALSTAAALAGCTSADGEQVALDNDPPLSSIDDIFEGTPADEDIKADLGKFDDILPATFTDLRETQSAVKSQGSRGVCSIFSTLGYMEHLYLVEGTLPEMDFSEQHLQWSAKFEIGSFPNTSGSNANFNLQAVNRFGVVLESVSPYETQQWDEADDPACDGEDSQPTRCYTNGEPSDEIKNADKWFLPRPRFMSMRDAKAHMKTTNTGVVVGFTFFYQAWNHRRSDLPTTAANWNKGIVVYPNSEDKEVSLEKRAGHSILVMGWDDNMEVQRRDAEGEPMVDANGEPVMEKGFYLFKNSWGTSGFGIDNEHGAGYGWISQRYLSEFGRARIAGIPNVEKPDEICDDGDDNDFNGDVDCDDAACAADVACAPESNEVSFTGAGMSIPDNDAVGVSSPIQVVGDVTTGLAGTIDQLSVSVDITHTWIGDLEVSLVRGDETIVLHNQAGGSTDDLVTTFAVDGFTGTDLGGDWTLHISDNAGRDIGDLNEWTLSAVVH